MYIAKWLMGHPIIAAWVLAAVAILLAFGSGDSSDDVSAATTTTTTKGNPVSKELKEVKTSINSALSDGKIIVADKVATSATKSDIANSSVPSKTIFPPEVKVSGESKPALQVPSLKPKDQPKKTTSTVKPSPISDLGQVSNDEMLLMAREAFWNNGLDEAAQIYEKLIKIEPNVLEHKGELGNVYWRQGFPQKAAELYSEIAIPMIDQGKTDKVANMIGFIGQFYPGRAAEINKRILMNSHK